MRIAKFRKPLTIALDSGVYNRVKQITDVQARSMADWVREAVDEALSRPNAEQTDLTQRSSVNGGK
jgi:predicted transcriptional regulator